MYHNKSLSTNKIHDDFKHELTNPEGSFAKFMFNSKNLRLFTKHNIDFVSCNTVKQKDTKTKETKESNKPLKLKESKDTIYKPFKKDSLFWCFFILCFCYFHLLFILFFPFVSYIFRVLFIVHCLSFHFLGFNLVSTQKF